MAAFNMMKRTVYTLKGEVNMIHKFYIDEHLVMVKASTFYNYLLLRKSTSVQGSAQLTLIPCRKNNSKIISCLFTSIIIFSYCYSMVILYPIGNVTFMYVCTLKKWRLLKKVRPNGMSINHMLTLYGSGL